MESKILSDDFLDFFKDLKKPPKKLYYRGNLELLRKRKIAIIGSRKMSIYTKNCVFSLASMLKNSGICVVSGGALGVDINASIAAMPYTIGIFANGLNQIYPKSNEKIIKQMYQEALALSEYEEDYIPKKYDFLLRNRLIIALSEAVVVAQADINSGSMQSAKLALELKKPLYVLPHRINESSGTNLFLKEKKAELIYDFKEFVGQFAKVCEDVQDEFLDFCKKGVSVDEALAIYGEKVYEYELEGKISVEGLLIRVLK
ncbi:DNA-processing protein DprA [Campylobacter molothri]|uniref:DNA-protecting protein DprA n=1 Tax=Campylobacter molothri TaxID=1032242 RepID=A0ACC5W1L4_9BACT|nr:DNA-protecting protein DprA [Campylobacter sp. RM10543]MBZ7937763.1 DNA-protecting protein DprA [Campylobacter sp. RM10538]MBZ7958590.1 DNA-protecting protein DprA [Campylobacter sp. RM9760]MBZ7967174.1 DNA-protecting protein DprA [Campylobacter sp. RM9756]MBZ7974832.1 DNA-protecting protein DprA [Campylobacter sp. RM9754]